MGIQVKLLQDTEFVNLLIKKVILNQKLFGNNFLYPIEQCEEVRLCVKVSPLHTTLGYRKLLFN